MHAWAKLPFWLLSSCQFISMRQQMPHRFLQPPKRHMQQCFMRDPTLHGSRYVLLLNLPLRLHRKQNLPLRPLSQLPRTHLLTHLPNHQRFPLPLPAVHLNSRIRLHPSPTPNEPGPPLLSHQLPCRTCWQYQHHWLLRVHQHHIQNQC